MNKVRVVAARRLNETLDGRSRQMAMIGELIFQVVGEFVGYGTGRVLVALFTPNIRVARSKTPPWPDPQKKRRFFSLTFVRDGQRYYLDETITAIGILFWLLVVALIAIWAVPGASQ